MSNNKQKVKSVHDTNVVNIGNQKKAISSLSLTTLKDLLKVKIAILKDKNWASTNTEFHKECRIKKSQEVEDLTESIAKLECFELLKHENEKLVKEKDEAMELILSQSSSIIDLMRENEKLKEYSNTFKCLAMEKQNQEFKEALKTTHAALKDLVHQLPTDERLADYELDFAEHADFKAEQALKK